MYIILSRFIVIIVFLTGMMYTLSGQVFIQLEHYDDPVSTRFFIGDYFMYQTSSTGKKWFNEKIESIQFDEEMVYFTSGMLKLDEITKVKVYKRWARGFGDLLIRFGGGWFAYAGVTHFLNEDWNFGWDTAAIGGTAIFLGFLMKKVVATSTYNVKKKNRLRIMDIQWPEAGVD